LLNFFAESEIHGCSAFVSSKSVMMKRDEGFMFSVDVNAGYFRLTVEDGPFRKADRLPNFTPAAGWQRTRSLFPKSPLVKVHPGP